MNKKRLHVKCNVMPHLSHDTFCPVVFFTFVLGVSGYHIVWFTSSFFCGLVCTTINNLKQKLTQNEKFTTCCYHFIVLYLHDTTTCEQQVVVCKYCDVGVMLDLVQVGELSDIRKEGSKLRLIKIIHSWVGGGQVCKCVKYSLIMTRQ